MIDSPFTEVMQTSLEQIQDAHADEALTERFEQAMSRPEASDGVEDGLVKSISELKHDLDSAKRDLKDNMQLVGNDPAQLMQMQWALTRITFQEELIAKTVGKTVQNIETLVKAQ